MKSAFLGFVILVKPYALKISIVGLVAILNFVASDSAAFGSYGPTIGAVVAMILHALAKYTPSPTPAPVVKFVPESQQIVNAFLDNPAGSIQ